jgi:hypothetical protein
VEANGERLDFSEVVGLAPASLLLKSMSSPVKTSFFPVGSSI